jgi:hypothetical protein
MPCPWEILAVHTLGARWTPARLVNIHPCLDSFSLKSMLRSCGQGSSPLRFDFVFAQTTLPYL